MVERATLSQQLVDEAQAPAQGERWISDTRQRGFGLRIWRSNDGEARKAYCIRAVDRNGRSIRRTLPIWEACSIYREENWWEFKINPLHEPTIGELAQVARRWAHDELARLKGKPTIAEEDKAQRRIGQERANALTFARAAELLLNSSSKIGLTEAYRDRLRKLFSKHVPPHVAERVCEVTLDDVSIILNAGALKPGNLRIFRPFIAQLLDIPSRFGVKVAATPYRLNKISMLLETGSTAIAPLCGWTMVDYERFFERFETEQDKWQQARCLRLYFRLPCPLSPLLKARWDQLWVVTVREGTSHTGNSDQRIQWRYDESWRGVHTLGRERANGL